MQPITEALSPVELGAPVQFLNLTLFPLLVADDATPRYAMLDDALALKTARVTEVSESGSVPELLFINDGDIPVMLVDGEELVGARQNRILNLTLLVGAKKQVVIPVSCVEQGRWTWKAPALPEQQPQPLRQGPREEDAASIAVSPCWRSPQLRSGRNLGGHQQQGRAPE